MKQLIECVPNISEGRDKNIIDQVTAEIEKVEGVKLLDVDPGMTTNRTVITFVGEPEPVCEAAYRVVKKAAELIDMSQHHGAHPRQGATDVCPLIPVSNITMEEVVEYAHKLGKRLGDELNIPIYCYEEAAFIKERRNLAYCRTGEYESLASRLGTEQWKPDFGPNEWNEHVAHTGATQVGARDFLVAINYNLNTTSTRRANAIAFDVRERQGDWQADERRKRQTNHDSGNAESHQGHRLVHRGLWHRPSVDEHHQHQRVACPCLLRGGLCQGRCPWRARHGLRNRRPCAQEGADGRWQVLSRQAATQPRRERRGNHEDRRQVDGPRRPEALRPEGKGHRIPH